MRLGALTLLSLLIGLFAGCGSGGGGDDKPSKADDEKAVREAATTFGSAASVEDTGRMCDLIGTRTRERLKRLAAAAPGTQDCAAVLKANLEELGGRASLADGPERVDRVEISGDRARAFADDVAMPLRRTDDGWRVEPVDVPAVAYVYDASIACSEGERLRIGNALPPPTRSAIARSLRRDAQSIARIRRGFRRLTPSADKRTQHAAMLRDLRAFERAARAMVRRIAGPGELVAAFRGPGQRVQRLNRRVNRRARRLGITCRGDEVRGARANEFYTQARRICRPASRRARRARPQGRAEVIAHLERLAGTEQRVLRRLRRLDPPTSYARLFRRTLARARQSVAAVREAASVAEAGNANFTQVARANVLDVTTLLAFARMEIEDCVI